MKNLWLSFEEISTFPFKQQEILLQDMINKGIKAIGTKNMFY